MIIDNLAAYEILKNLLIIQIPLGLPAWDVRLIVANLLRAAISFLGIIILFLFLYAGLLWMTAGGNEESVAKAKKTIINAIIGLIIILLSNTLVNFVIRTVL